jgi:plasmid stabilization system protein ParE
LQQSAPDSDQPHEPSVASKEAKPPWQPVGPNSQEVADIRLLLADFFDRLQDLSNPTELLSELEKLRQSLLEADPTSAAAALIEELRSGIDRTTGLPFLVGPEGVLDSAPTWRTSLLDWLGQMDPREAAAYSREILATTNSADEYALALRNFVWATPPPLATAEVADYLQTMLQRPEWRQNPSTGFLEAFDIAIEIGPTGLRQMAEALRTAASSDEKSDRAIEHAAFLALDRIFLRDPNLFIQTVEQSPELLQNLPDHRASLYARLDVRDTAQAAFLENYLIATPPESPEMLYFFSVFPNPNRFVNHRLVSQPAAEATTEPMAEVDRATVEQARRWLADPRMAPHQENLRFLILRLEEFL